MNKIIKIMNAQYLQQVKNFYNLPFLKIGMNVIVISKVGKISGVYESGLKAKLFDSNETIYFHPTYETVYFDDNWKVIKDFRKKTIKEKATF